MKREQVLLRCIAAALFLLFVSCAGPKAELTSVWKDEAYRGGYFRKILVISAARKEAVRNFSEDEFVRQLKGRGTDSVASYTSIPFDKMLDKAYIMEKTRGMGIDGILVTRVLYTLTAAPPLPKQPNWHEFYSDSLGYEQMVSAPKLSPGKTIARIEMNLYEARSEKPVWSASSDVPVRSDPRDDIKAFVTLVAQQLSREKLIP